MRRYNDIAPPQNISPEGYMKWYFSMIKKYGKNVFAKYGIALPDEFEELSPIEKELLNEQVNELVYKLTKDTRSKDEDFIAEHARFVEEYQWEAITEGNVETHGAYFKLYKGKNYELEFVRLIPDVLLHILCNRTVYEYYPIVFDTLIDLMQPVTPTHWRVGLSFEESVIPFYEQRRGDFAKVTSSYCIKFENACNLPGSPEIITKNMNRILANFILPERF